MKELLRQIYDDLANGRLSQQEAMARVKALKLDRQGRSGTLFVRPVWQPVPLTAAARAAYGRRHVLVVDLPGIEAGRLPGGHGIAISTDRGKNLAGRYTDAALQAFQALQDILQRPRENVLVQIVVADDLFAGLSGLLRTASLENPRVIGQVILVAPDLSTEEAARLLEDEQSLDAVVRYQDGERQVLRWDELPPAAEPAPVAFQDGAVYLITGGAGRLAGVFAREIAGHTSARVVLTGRSPWTGETLGDRVSYRQADIGDLEQVTSLIASIRDDYGRLDGILHCAGTVADNFIIRKNGDEFARVLAPKVAGAFHLDEATRDLDLDFFVLFSSVSGAAGSIGQADYATANAFMDRFSAWRNGQAAAGLRHGRTRSINWSWWEAGGMEADAASGERLLQTTGMQPMPTATGMRAFHRVLSLPWDQVGVAEGDFARMRVAWFSGRLIEPERAAVPAPPVASAPIERSTFVEKARDFLRNECAHVLGLKPGRIDPQAPLEDYGIDSILAVRLTTHLERTFGPLAKTLFFEYGTIAELTGYFLESHSERLEAVLAAGKEETPAAETPRVERRVLERRRLDRGRAAAPAPAQPRESEPIAIIGLSGRYPEAVDVDAYWRNLRDGKDCITEVPKERWDWQQYFSDDRTKSGHHYSKWGGFITGVDEFDPLFFNISPKEAKYLDPQERLFLQHAWMAIEDAGYTRAALQIADADDLPGQVGVYAGVMYTEYQLFGAEAAARGQRLGVAGSMASIANRVSYSLNLHGPSVTLDTMCSSSLTAIHFACLDLKQGRTGLAIAGGVNVTVHPNKYLVLSSGQFIASDGHCQSFGEGGDGYIPGEGVGVVILKRLSDAERDGDRIYGVIRGTALNHGGKTNGYTVPNPQAQASVIRRALLESGTDARHVSYIEAHGTGTKLGDPIEIAALTRAFAKSTQDTGFCLLGSAKSNIGHCESAAGVAGLTKVLLQMQHRQIVPSLHSAQLNPNIDFEKTPFVVNQTLRPWEQPVVDGRQVPRIAGLSSFGAGGSNAHVVIEEYQAPAVQPVAFRNVAIVLSARTAEQLRQKVQDLLDFVRARETVDLAAMAYTLQAGREAMDERLGFVVSSAGQLIARLEAWLAGEDEDSYQGQVRRDKASVSLFSTDAGLRQTVETWIANGELAKLVELWAKGLELDWAKLYGGAAPQRISLPTYPFAKERYWIDVEAAPVAGAEAAVLHPLLHRNTSDLTQQSYSSRFHEPLAAPAYLEMARAAVRDAAGAPGEAAVELREVQWAQPLPAVRELSIALLPDGRDDLRFEIYSTDDEIVHCQGRAAVLRDGSRLREPDGELFDLPATNIEAPAPVRTRREIPLTVEAKKRGAIALGAPGAVGALERSPEKARLTLSNTVVSTPSAPSSVKLYDDGDGVFSIEIGAAGDGIAPIRQALDAVRAEASAKVLLLRGLERASLDYGEAVEQKLFEAIVSFPYPTIALLHGDAGGAAFLAAALCDFVVCNEDATYASPEPNIPALALLGERFGDLLAQDFLYRTSRATGRELRAKGWTCAILPAEQLEAHSQTLASALTEKSQEALQLLKQHLTRGLVERVTALTPVGRVESDAAAACEVIVLSDDLSEDVLAGLRQRIAESEVPVVAALTGNATGDVWLAAQSCDACVYSRQGMYSAAGIGETAAGLFAYRLGNEAAREILLSGAGYSGIDLEQRVPGLIAVDGDRVVATAEEVAASWGRLPRTALAAWKRHSAAILAEQTFTSAPVEPEAADAPAAVPQSNVVTVTPHANGVVVVKMEEREARNMFSGDLVAGLNEAFAHIARTPAYKVVVLTGYDTYFASGGTKESLLAIQAGTIRFTDQKIFQLPLDCRLPVIAAMQGHGLGAGWALGMFADVALLSEESRYVSPYMSYGFTPGAGATFILADKMGQDLARESLLTAQTYTGSELKTRGLRLPVLRRADVLPAALALADRMAQASRERLIALKRQLTAYVHQPLEETYRRELGMHDRTFVGHADTAEKIRVDFYPDAAEVAQAPAVPVAAGGSEAVRSVTATVRTLLAAELQVNESDVHDDVQFVDLGLDSIGGVSLMRKVNEKYGTSIEATKIYSYPTLAQLARYIKAQAEQKGTLAVPAAPAPAIAPKPAARKLTSWRTATARLAAGASAARPQAVAIIGMAGQFPQAPGLDQFWQNLAEGKNCISQVSADRWDLETFYQPDAIVPGKTNCPYMGALDEYDRFDPLFFNISPVEAEHMDPQQRLFLQSCWHTIEHAGYDARALSGTKCGVFVGCAAGDYHDRSPMDQLSSHGFTGGATSILAARISYFLNLQGPCVAIDTACSSSLVAIAQACDNLNAGGSDVALAGGVYVMTSPAMHVMTAQAGMLSPEGKCFTFDQRADGFVPGEAVGVVMLKRLADAERDGDTIYGVIEGWGINQDGKTNGITAPNPESQTRLEQEVYDRHGIDPSHIQLIEAHGTGTKLGDPIEIEGLQNAFGKYTANRQYCALGSVKSNIGHCLTAAGIAGVIKLLLALEHKKLPPTINFERLNEHIDLTNSPFFVNTSLQDWQLHNSPRRLSAISSFGFSGTNAHLVIGEAPIRPVGPIRPVRPTIVPLSARTPEQLREKAADLLTFLRTSPSVDLTDVAYTLQTGRTPMDERLGFVVSSLDQLAERLQNWLEGAAYIQDCRQGRVKRGTESPAAGADDKPSKVLELWVRGTEVDWNLFYGDDRPRRVALPVYPFVKERYWLEPAPVAAPASALHPLLHANASDFSQQSYSATFTGNELFLAHHQVRAGRGTLHKFLPGVAYLEMARAAIRHALPEPPEARVLELRDFVWAQPVVVTDRKEVRIALIADEADQIEYEIYSGAGDEEVVHAQGRAVLASRPVPPALDLAQLESAMTRGRLEPDGIYAAFAAMGLMYGPTFQAVTSIRRGSGQALASLRLPEGADGEYVLHPSLMDGAIQACLGLLDSADAVTEPRVPFAVDALRVFAPCTRDMRAWVRSSPGSTTKLDIDLCDVSGHVAVQLHGFTLRAVAQPQQAGRLYATPVWQAETATAASDSGYAERHVLVCEPDARQNIAERYTAHALACFERIETILRARPQGRVLFQAVVPEVLYAGLSALLKTAALENPQFAGQVIVSDLSADDLAARLQQENGLDAVVRYTAHGREVLQWQEILTGDDAPPAAFRDSGVYLITGGLGALGTVFANEILARTSQARVVLTGRSPLTSETQSPRVSYRQVDLTDLAQVTRLIASVRNEHGRLDGILHCAGAIADNFILKKSGEEFRQVLAPKVAGTFHLDEASRDVELDFFVLFSSVAGAAGNVGQADYAAANAFMDGFAASRNREVAAKTRSGSTRSINWPLWLAGGMRPDEAKLELLQKTTGAQPMQTATGIDAFYRSLALPYDQLLVAEGDLACLRRAVLTSGRTEPEPQQPARPAPAPSGSLAERTQELLRRELAGLLKLASHKLDPLAPLETYGIDSILAMKLTNRLEQTFGSLPKTLFFEYQTLGELASYFATAHAARLAALFAGDGAVPTETVETRPDAPSQRKLVARRRFSGTRTAGRAAGTDREPIAIIGLSGRYPEAVDLDAYWRNLRDGKDCITEVPKERWDWREYFTGDRTESGGHYSKWGGFIAGVDEFDPLFFNISPREAKVLDPQERLFLQHTWMAIEDAGYTRATLQAPDANDLPGQVGVYAGVMYIEYQLFGAAALAQGKRVGVPGSMASIANRVSYALNLHGPSMTLDTMCSSSLSAIHLACQDLRAGRTSLGIAGGVNVSIHPNKYFVLSAGQFISSDGHCQSFGEGGDGYIPGEGVGVVVLKRLADAKRDGDHIYGVIRGTALNHGGKTNGYSVPNPQAQASVIARALAESGVDARHVSYIEAHGTGTKLGDPIEIAALSKAFGQTTQDTGFCLIGSAKSNIGHCESAAGIAGLTKVLLQMRHRQIVPSLHSAQLNPNIDFEKTPFVVNQSLRSWEQPVIDGRPFPRIAGLSSFGAGGSNAHLIIEEYPTPVARPASVPDAVIVLSARTAEQLRQKAQDLLDFVRPREAAIDLAAMAYTLQTGREAMDERLGLVVSTAGELLAKLEAWVAGGQEIEDLYHGQVKRNREALSLFSTDTDLQLAVEKWIEHRKIPKLLDLWVKGLEVDWSRLHGEAKPPRISLPVYPFAKDRYWIDIDAVEVAAARPVQDAVLHPLLHRNASDLREQRYLSTFTGDELFVADTGVQKVVPAVVCLEMARAAIVNALPEMPEAGIELQDVEWGQPIVAGNGEEIAISLFANGEDEVEFEIYGERADEDGVHCRGRAVVSRGPAPAALDLAQLERDGQRLARLQVPAGADDTAYVLHPSLLDGAMQACASLNPLSLASMRIVAPAGTETIAWVRKTGDAAFDVDLCDPRGNVCVQLRGIAGQLAAGEPAAAAPRERKEIAFLAAQQPPAARKAAGISLATPGAAVPLQAPAAPRASVALSTAGALSAAPPVPAVRLYDDGDGIFSIEAGASSSRDAVAQLRRALEAARQQDGVKVLLVRGVERCFARGGSEDFNEALAQGLYQAVASFPWPVIAVADRGAAGAAFVFDALCDFMVCAEGAKAGYGLEPSIPMLELFAERFGAPVAQELLYPRANGGTSPVVPVADANAYAGELASSLAEKSRDALRLLKQHLTRRIAGRVAALAPIDTASEAACGSGHVLVVEFAKVDLRQVLDEAGGSSAIVLVGDADGFAGATAQVERLLLDAPVPVVAALPGNARGSAWGLAQCCDAVVHAAEGVYSAAGVSPLAAALFLQRFGNGAAEEILLTGADYRGADLRGRVPAAIVAESAAVRATAVNIAESWARWPRAVLASWKSHSAAKIREKASSLSVDWEPVDDAPSLELVAPAPIALHSRAVHAAVHPGGIVVVTMEDRDAKNAFSDALIQGLTEAFAHIGQTPGYTAVVLTGYDRYFASGGTKDSLLAIEAGKAKFTDTRVFQAALDCPLPVIAAMQGHAVGAGWSLGMFADVVLLSEESRYVSPYMDYGFTPGAGATWILGNRIGQDAARESLLTARPLTGRALREKALHLRVLPRAGVLAAATALAGQIAQQPRHRAIALKQQWTAEMRQPLEETYRLELAMHEQTFVGRADTLARIEKNFHDESEAAPRIAVRPADARADADVLPAIVARLKTLLANELEMNESDIDEHAQFVDLGLDSISSVTWLRKINESYQTSIEATKVYSYPTVAQLSRLVKEEAEKHGTLARPAAAPGPAAPAPAPVPVLKPQAPAARTSGKRIARRARGSSRAVPAAAASRAVEKIAIIGMAGQFPQARNLDEFWRNLAEGKNCITQVPASRWDLPSYYQPGAPVAGKTYSRWMGALDEQDRFDPVFFNISPTEAEYMDPQQRLFLQSCWHTIEHAGYDARALSGTKCGVFVGCASGEYHVSSPSHQLSAHGFTGGATSILAGRISYFLNLQGPCVAIDTACSSSLVAIAQACDSLNTGASDTALAGGVYVMAGPAMHIMTSQAGMLSPEGKCFSFDQRADGFVPGEAVGAVMLKRLSDAERDGDVIYGVLEGWGVNQDGRTNGITAPNPESQTRLEQEVYDRYGIDPAHIQLIEAHGTGTKLGDPIEVEGLQKAFGKYTQNTRYCALGTVKSNIGHCLTAAGVAGVIKLLLALQHKQLPPTINFERLNEHIDLTGSPFFVNTSLEEWQLHGASRRLAAISSFGFSGTNAHLVISEAPIRPISPIRPIRPIRPTIIPLSARTPDQLREKANDLLTFLRTSPSTDLTEIACTLQTGRTPMDERLAFLVDSTGQLEEKLQACVDGARSIENSWRGQVKRTRDALSLFNTDPDLQDTIDRWIANGRLARLADLWVSGIEIDWRKLYGEGMPRRVALPGYPFAKDRYWITPDAAPEQRHAAALHPLLHENVSDLSGQRYRSTFSGTESFLEDGVLPPAVCLEMVHAAVRHALSDESAMPELHDVVWGEPFVANAGNPISVSLEPAGDEAVAFEIYSLDVDREIVHCRGRATVTAEQPAAPELAQDDEQAATLLAAPVWKARELERAHGAAAFAEHHVVLCGLPDIDAARLGASTLSLETDGHTDLASRYTEHALASFERIQAILQSKPRGRVLFQIVIRDREDDAPLAGLSALLKTAGQEHPHFIGQVLLVPQDITAGKLAAILENEKTGGLDASIRYERDVRQVLRWSELPADPAPAPVAFRERGVYLITGGTGGLGVVFAKEILAQREAAVVLTGRSPLTKETQHRLDELSAQGGRVSYRQLDLTDLDQVVDAIAGIQDEHRPLTGILHCAGMAADEFIVRKTSGDLARVLAPKVTGTVHLDEATKDLPLDFFVLFSSVAAVLGNAAQADYAAANAFLDGFAALRNRQVDAGQRHGRTRSIDWPLWEVGGMQLDAVGRERLKEGAGLVPMPAASGMQAFHRGLASPHDQLLVLEGMPAKIAAHLQKVRAFDAPETPVELPREAVPGGEQLQQEVKTILAAVLKVDGAAIDVDQPFVELGLDSFLGAELMVSINRKFGTDLAHIVVFDHPTVRELSGFLEKHLGTLPRQRVQAPPAPAPARVVKKKSMRKAAARQDAPRDERIAIIGMSGRYPQADNLAEYWSNLAAGRNCVTEVPASRWDVRRHYDPDRTRKDTTYSKWLGAIDDVECFDPLFFRISPGEAEHIDPQHRLFLQESYRAFEDAGYSPDALANRKGGVYLGISTNEYTSLLARSRSLSAPVTSNSSAIAAARIAYYLNLKGPAIAVDTACSSALVAIHLACQAIARGEVDFALAGGVTLWFAPESYVAMSQAGMFSPDGQCKTFDDSANGIVNGDGVGAVVLKRLEDAERDGDFIYGVILGSGINQDGKTNGITAPSVASQIELERGIYTRYGIDPGTITYVEAHGTGTKLGDPIELEALSTVFREKTDRKRFCALGSVKSNIGHTTSAAGVAGVHKVLLSMRHRTLVPTLNVTQETTRFDFENSPFYLSRETQPWNAAPGAPRRAAVSSFGFSGTNAHLVLEEYAAPAAPAVTSGESTIVPLSARTPEQLRQRAADLLDCILTSERPLDLAGVAYTLQTGREAMEERLGFVVSSLEQLTSRLRAYVDGEKNIDGFCRARVEPGGEGMAVVGRDEDMQEAIGKWIARRKLAKLLDLWVRGVSFDWNELHAGVLPRRVSLPAYPFRKDRCWVDAAPPAEMLEIHRPAGETLQSIDDILDQIGSGTIEDEQAVSALKLLV